MTMGIIDDAYLLSDVSMTTVMVMPIGKFKTAKYPKLNLDRSMAEEMVKNFDAKVLGATEPFIDSSGKHDESAPAAGWVKRLYISSWKAGEALFADVEWTSVGKNLVREKLYKYLSPVIAPHVIPETGEKVYPVLRSMSLTNVPVLRMMPAVEASETGEYVAIACSELVPVAFGYLSEDGEQWEAEEVMDKEADTSAPDDLAQGGVVPEAASVVIGDGEPEVVIPVAQNPESEDEIAEENPAEPEDSSEVPAEDASVEEPEEDIIEQMMQVLSKLNSRVRYKRGAPALRALMKEAIAKARTTAAGDELDIAYVVAELQTILAEFDESGKEMNNMEKLIAKFSLAEDATEDDILAAFEAKLAEVEAEKQALADAKAEDEVKFTELSEKLEAAEAEIAASKQAAHEAEIEHRLADAVSQNLVTPAEVGDAENPGWLRKLAFTDEVLFDECIDSRKAPAVDLSEQGAGEPEEEVQAAEEEVVRPDIKLAALGREYAAEHPELSIAEAQNAVRLAHPELDAEYREWVQENLQVRR